MKKLLALIFALFATVALADGISGGAIFAPGGSTTQLQRNVAGAFGGISGATSNGTVITLSSGSLNLSGATSGTAILNAPGTGGGTLTLPSGSDTIAGIAASQTFTNKTLTAPTLTTPALGVAGGTSLALGGCTIGANALCLTGTSSISSNEIVGGSLMVGSTTALTLTTGAVGMQKITASASAPGAAGAKLELVCGTNAGTAKLVIYAGTSATAVTVVDNIGAAVTGC